MTIHENPFAKSTVYAKVQQKQPLASRDKRGHYLFSIVAGICNRSAGATRAHLYAN